MRTILEIIGTAVVVGLAGGAVGYLVRKNVAEGKIATAEEQAIRIVQDAEQTGGSVTLTSEPGKGTKVRAVFHSDHIDCPPWGDLPGTVALLITGNPEINVCFEYRSGETGYSISTNEIKEILDGVPLSHPKVMLLIKEMIKENIRS